FGKLAFVCIAVDTSRKMRVRRKDTIRILLAFSTIPLENDNNPRFLPILLLQRLVANLKTQLVDNEVVRVKIPKCMAWLDDETIRDLDTMDDKVNNPSTQSTPQFLLLFEVYTPPVTYPEKVGETIGILMEVKPLDHTKLEDLGLSTSNDIPFSSSEIPSVDEPEP
nr:hypothetical protein [Tanacetum cinerariifolium]